MNLPYQIILADDHARFRLEIRKILNEIQGIAVIAEIGDGHELFKLLETLRPDAILLDISMPNLQGMKATQIIKSLYPEIKVIMMVLDGDSEYLAHAKAAGADGILLKENSPRDLESAILKVRRGGRYFSRFLEGRKVGDIVKNNRLVGFPPKVS